MKYLKFLLYFACFAAPFGSAYLAVPIGGFQLSMIRGAIALVTFGLVIVTLKEKRKLVLAQKGNGYAMILMTVWFLYAIVSFFWCEDKSSWINHVYALGFGCICIFLCNNIIETKAEALKALVALHLGLLVQAFIGLYEVFTLDYHFAKFDWRELKHFNAGQRIPYAMGQNQNNFAFMMFFAFLIAYLLFVLAKDPKRKGFYLVSMLLEGSLLSLTYSRACMIGLYMAVALILIVNLINRNWKMVIFLLAACTFFQLVPGFVNPAVGSGVTTMSADLEGSDSIRVTLIKNGLYFVKKSYGCGIGAGQAHFWLTTKPYADPRDFFALHNWWIEIMAEYGILVFAGYIIYYIKMFWDNFKVVKFFDFNHSDKQISLFICAVMCGFVFACISSSSIALIEYVWLFWAVIITLWRNDFLPRLKSDGNRV